MSGAETSARTSSGCSKTSGCASSRHPQRNEGSAFRQVPRLFSPPVKRILVIGSGGAGKSTFASELGAILDLPVTHLDQVYWTPGWEKPSKDEWSSTIDQLVAQPEWILDGNFGGTLPQRI